MNKKPVDRAAYEDRVVARALKILESRVRYGQVLSSPESVKTYLRLKLDGKKREEFWVLYLDSQHRVLEMVCEFVGTIDAASVYPREILRKAVMIGASACIFAHNHPSGNPEPSAADRSLTERLKNVLTNVDVRVLDHMVVGDTVTSFAERGWI